MHYTKLLWMQEHDVASLLLRNDSANPIPQSFTTTPLTGTDASNPLPESSPNVPLPGNETGAAIPTKRIQHSLHCLGLMLPLQLLRLTLPFRYLIPDTTSPVPRTSGANLIPEADAALHPPSGALDG